MTGANGLAEMRWMPGLAASCPGAVDLTAIGPLGPIGKAATLPEALVISVAIDLLCLRFQTASAAVAQAGGMRARP